MTIKNIDYYVNNLWDWSVLDGCFGDTNIQVTDLDGVVERNGRFLILECKSHDADIPTGQDILFRRLMKTGYFTIFVIWGNPGIPEKMCAYDKHGGKQFFHEVNIEVLRNFVGKWFERSNT